MIPIGTIIERPKECDLSQYKGFIQTNGTELNRKKHAELFELIGTQHGDGNGKTTFNIPDIQSTESIYLIKIQ